MGICASNAEVKPFRLLLLGPGGVGKSTLFRQIKLHQTEGFTEVELQDGSHSIRSMLHATLTILMRNDIVQDALSPEARNECEDALMDIQDIQLASNQQKLHQLIKKYWQTNGVRKALKHVKIGKHHEAYLSSNEWLQYWIDEADRVLKAGFVPTNDDMLKLRRPTSGVQELHFTMRGEDFVLVDVGGQTHEMKTWEQELEKDIGGLVFMVSLADFDRVGKHTTSRLIEGIAVLEDVLQQSAALQKLPLVCMMNKVDLFEERMASGATFHSFIPECPKSITT